MNGAARLSADSHLQSRVEELVRAQNRRQHRQMDRVFVVLMLIQWIGGILAAIFISPRTWIGEQSLVHIHVWTAIALGGILSAAPIFLAVLCPGTALTRHVIAIAQGLWSALLIHLMGGKIETHFHIFGSLAFIAFYRDWRVLLTMTVVVIVDHAVRGVVYPLSVYGVALESPYRWIEHAGWVVFEDIVLVLACVRGQREVVHSCSQQAMLENINTSIEEKVELRSHELQDARDFLHSVLDSLKAQICVVDHQGTITETNAVWSQTTDSSARNTVQPGTNYIDVCRATKGEGAVGANEVADAIEKVIAGELTNYESEYDCHSPSKSQWYQVNITPLKSHEGGAVITHTDITDRVQAQRRLKTTTENLELLSLVAKYTDNAVVIMNRHGQIEWVNEGFVRTTGYELAEVIGKIPGHFLCGEKTDPETVEMMRRCITQQKGFDGELITYRKDGTSYWLAIEVRPILNEQGEVEKFIAIESDISERKRAEAEKEKLSGELQEAARRAGMAEVATGILHNVGNVMNSINVAAQTLHGYLESSATDRLAKVASIVSEHESDLPGFLAGERGQLFPSTLNQLSERLCYDRDQELKELRCLLDRLDHVRHIISKQQSIARESKDVLADLSLQALIHDAARMCRPEHSSSLQWRISLDCNDLPNIVSDKHKILQVLINLIRNAGQAVKERGPEGRVNVRAWSTDTHVRIRVADNGVGISADHLNRIFSHGFTTKSDGHGFGLHSSALDAKSLGGSLTVTSEGLGKGACFTLALPVVREKTHPTSSVVLSSLSDE